MLDIDTEQKRLVLFADLGEEYQHKNNAESRIHFVPDAGTLDRVRTTALEFFQIARVLDDYVQSERIEMAFEAEYGWVDVRIQRFMDGIPCMSYVSAEIDPITLKILDFSTGRFFPPASTSHTLSEHDARSAAQAFFVEHAGHNRVDTAELIIAEPMSHGITPLESIPMEMRVCWLCTLQIPEEELDANVRIDANTGEIIGYDYQKGED
jgi:hypothetical protein